jgi:NMD protein affecting ribosome stability and mRNA decay
MVAHKKAYLDITVSICPHCGAPYADASWYVMELGSDVDCGVCGRTWNPKTYKVDRILVEFELTEEGTVAAVKKETCLE